MVVIKGKSSNTFTNRNLQDSKTSKAASGVGPFKIYPDSSKTKYSSRDSLNIEAKKSLPPIAGVHCASNMKSGTMINSGKMKGRCDSSVNPNARRKVLADISNVRGSFSRTNSKNNSKPMASVGSGIKIGSFSSNKPSTGEANCNKGRDSNDHLILGKASDNKDMKATSSDLRTRVQGRKSLTTSNRTLGRKALPSIRKSLQILKSVNEVAPYDPKKEVAEYSEENRAKHSFSASDHQNMKATYADLRTRVQGRKPLITTNRTSGRNPPLSTRKCLSILKPANKVAGGDSNKETVENSERGRAKCAFPVKPKIGTNVVPQARSTCNHLWRNRVSDGFILLASQGKAKVDTGGLLRKPSQLTRGNISSVSKARTSKSSVLNKSMARADALSKEITNKDVISIAKCVKSAVSAEQSAKEDISSGSNSMLDKSMENVARKKSLRRKSFTSLLMARPKLSEEQDEVSKDNLPDIYDDRNHLEVTEYVDDIYQYYWVMEAQSLPINNYMENQLEIPSQMRAILINWLIEVHLKFDLLQETLFLMVRLLDQYLSQVSIKKTEMQLVGLTALFLASKYEDFWHPRVMDLISVSAESYTRDQILEMERDFLKKLKFCLNVPTPYVFMLRFLRAAQSDQKFEHLAFYLIELCLVQYEVISYKPSLLCSSAIYLARKTLQLTPAWTPLLSEHTHYEESEIRGCAEMILKFHKAARSSLLKVTYEKYLRHEFSRVASIKPLDALFD